MKTENLAFPVIFRAVGAPLVDDCHKQHHPVDPLVRNSDLPQAPRDAILQQFYFFDESCVQVTPPQPGKELPAYCVVEYETEVPPAPPAGYRYIASSLDNALCSGNPYLMEIWTAYHRRGTPLPAFWFAPPKIVQEARPTWTPQGGGYYLPTSQAGALSQATNFQIIPRLNLCRHLKGGGIENTVSAQLTCMGQLLEEDYRVHPAEIDKLVATIPNHYACCFLDPAAKKDAPYLGLQFRQLALTVPKIEIFEESGWSQIGNQWVYAHDGASSQSDAVRFNTDFEIFHDPSMDAARACRSALYFLKVSTDLKATLIPVLYAHMAALWTLFNHAGHPVRETLYVYGTTGSLKTSVLSLLFNWTGKEENNIPARFHDTAASIEAKLELYRDRVLLVDDMAPMTTRKALHEQCELMEKITRIYGDGTAKSRCSGTMRLKEAPKTAGLCAFSGEDVFGSESSMLRYVLLHVTPETYDRQLLAVYQKNPALWTSHIYHFVGNVGPNFDHYTTVISESFAFFREKCAAKLHAGRVIDAAVSLMLTARILLEYAVYVGVIREQQFSTIFDIWSNCVIDVMSTSEAESKQESPVFMYIKELFLASEAGKIPLARDEKVYADNPDRYWGFIRTDFWYLQPDRIYTAVCAACGKRGEKFPLSKAKIHAALREAGLIQVQHERRGDKVTTLPLVKISSALPDGKRPRMLAINKNLALEFLENHEL